MSSGLESRARTGPILRIPDCETWREEVNAGEYDYVVTMYDPYLPGGLTDTKEGLWTREDPGTEEVLRDGPVSFFRVERAARPRGLRRPAGPRARRSWTAIPCSLGPLANQPPPRTRAS